MNDGTGDQPVLDDDPQVPLGLQPERRWATEEARIADRRLRYLDNLDELERRRVVLESELNENRARRQAEATRLKSQLQARQREMTDAEERDNLGRYEEAREAYSEIQDEIAESEGRLAIEDAATGSRLSEVQAEIATTQRRLSGLDGELERVADARRQHDADIERLRATDLESKLNELESLVEASREAAGTAGVADLSEDYARQAASHGRSWKIWGVFLALALAATAALGLWLLDEVHPDKDATTAEIVSSVTVQIFVVGIMLYAVRVTALQFRVHRHMEAVAANKAAALSTFNRIVAVASEKEVRAALAAVLAQSVFSSDETGFIGTSSDHVTIVERLAGPLADRAAGKS